jgi:vacuolar-type H+-ATPase subunit C/Vma6
MIDYAEKLLAIAKNYKNIATLLITRDKKSTVDEINDLIINAIELKQWVIKHNARRSD